MTPFQEIAEWNKERGLTNYSTKLEFRLLYEELMESILLKNAKSLAVDMTKNIETQLDAIPVEQESDAIADALGDIIFVAVGSLYKLGYNADAVLRNIIIANNNKGDNKDKDGKIIKNKNFDHPNHDNAKIKEN